MLVPPWAVPTPANRRRVAHRRGPLQHRSRVSADPRRTGTPAWRRNAGERQTGTSAPPSADRWTTDGTGTDPVAAPQPARRAWTTVSPGWPTCAPPTPQVTPTRAGEESHSATPNGSPPAPVALGRGRAGGRVTLLRDSKLRLMRTLMRAGVRSQTALIAPGCAARRPPVSRRLGRRPALDGIRGLAWSAVFFSHALTLPFAIGQVSMFVFFALSGFLITGLLLEERASTGRVSLSQFFARRALRLLPALGFFLARWLAVVLAHRRACAVDDHRARRQRRQRRRSPWVALQGALAALFYVSNWATIGHWFSGYVPLGHLWSLAVEEQFYLLWSPVVVLLLARRSRAAVGWAAAFAAVASFVDVALRDAARRHPRRRHEYRHPGWRLPRRRGTVRGLGAPSIVVACGRRRRVAPRRGWVSGCAGLGLVGVRPPRRRARLHLDVGGRLPRCGAARRGLPRRCASRWRHRHLTVDHVCGSPLLWPLPLALRVAHLARRHGTGRCASRPRRLIRLSRGLVAARGAPGLGAESPLHTGAAQPTEPAAEPAKQPRPVLDAVPAGTAAQPVPA